jgi:hypothetical protein
LLKTEQITLKISPKYGSKTSFFTEIIVEKLVHAASCTIGSLSINLLKVSDRYDLKRSFELSILLSRRINFVNLIKTINYLDNVQHVIARINLLAFRSSFIRKTINVFKWGFKNSYEPIATAPKAKIVLSLQLTIIT